MTLRRAAIVAALCACALGLIWIFTGREAPAAVVGNANVIGAVAGVLAVALTFVLLWSHAGVRRAESDGVTAEQAQAAVDYLAIETLRYWQIQAKDRRITTPSPAMVSWRWASEDVAAPADLRPELLTEGVVTRLREQLYDRLDAPARVVVLGGPGAGKTTAMLLLLIEVLEHRRADAGQPVPVWLTLGGWNPQTTGLLEWAASVLKRDYPGLSATVHGGPAAAAELIRTGRVALFLDGLDEMPPALQGRALELIDRDAVGLRVVMTSRPAEYQAAIAEGRLYRAAVIDVLPVKPEHARDFLLAEQVGERRHAWQQVTDHLAAHPESVAARTLTSPLALSLAHDAYARSDPRDLLDADIHPTPDALLRHLLARSLHLAYPEESDREYATRWLSWIARHMGTNRDLRWWDIPTWLRRWQRTLLVGLAAGFTFGLTFGLAAGFAIGSTAGLMGGVVTGLMSGLWVSFTGALEAMPQTLSKRRLSGMEAFRLLTVGLAMGPMAGLAAGLMFGLMFGLAVGPMFGLAFGLAVGLTVVWSSPLTSPHGANPTEVYRSDRRRTITVGLAFGLTFGLTIGLMAGLKFGLAIGLAYGLAFGVGTVLTFGSGPALELFKAELVLGLRGRRVRFVPLLETALQRQVLRQAGAVYQFRHAALQDLLASDAPIDPATPLTVPQPSSSGDEPRATPDQQTPAREAGSRSTG